MQVWFPGYGWQNFDPTAVVPLANPSPGSVLAHSADALPRPPALDPHRPGGGRWRSTVVLVRRRRRLRPPTWAHQVAADLERGGTRRGRRRRTDETLTAYGDRLAAADPSTRDGLTMATTLVERSTYGGDRAHRRPDRRGPGLHPAVRRRRSAGRRRRVGRVGPAERAAAPPQDRATASASSNEAPAASRGR